MSNYKQLNDPRDLDMTTRRVNGNDDVASLARDITNGIESLIKMNNKCERSFAKIGTPADNSDFRDRMHDDQNDANNKVRELMSLLQRGKNVLDRQQYTKLSTSFDREYKKYQKLQTSMDDKQNDVIQKAKQRDQPNGRAASAAAQDLHAAAAGGAKNGYGSNERNQALLMEDNIQFLEYDHEEIQRRTREIRLIESDVQEVAEMYKDMHLLVNQQQEGIDMIDENITNTKTHAENASQQLVEAEDHQRRARKKQCCLVMCIGTVIAVVVVIVYLTNIKS